MKNLNPNMQNPLDRRTIKQQLEEAEAFFAAPYLPLVPTDDPNPYADKDGLIEFIVASELVDNKIVMEKLKAQKAHLVALTSIVTDYINRYAAHYGQEYKTDVKLWELAMSKLPLMGPSSIERQTYSRQSLGIKISKDFVEFIMGVVLSQGSTALTGFQKFLEKQGEALEIGVEHNKDGYHVITIGVTVEVFSLGQEIIYTPKIKQYKIIFDRVNSSFNSCCVKVEVINIHFDYQYAVNVFDYEALEDPEVKKVFDEFVKKSRKAQINNSSTFFNDDFPV